MRQVLAFIAIGFFLVLFQVCAASAKQLSHETLASPQETGGTALTDEAFAKKVDQHLDRQDRPGTTLMFR